MGDPVFTKKKLYTFMVQTKCGAVDPQVFSSCAFHNAEIEMEPYKMLNVDVAHRDMVWWWC